MFSFNKKSGFTLAEILITLGLIGAVSAITIPTLAYNYRAKVLEEQYRSAYSDLKQIGAMINLERVILENMLTDLIVWVTGKKK